MPPTIGNERGKTGGHGLQQVHREALREGRHGIDVCGKEMRNVKALSPEGNVARDSKLTDESLESLAHRSVTDACRVGAGL
jgi:hypothetical protein